MLIQAAMLLPMCLHIFALPLGRNFGCEKQLSVKGLNYFTIVLFNNRKIDMPCPPGKLYRHPLCRCDYPPEEVTTVWSPNTTPAKQPTKSTYKPTQGTGHTSIAPSTSLRNNGTVQDTGHTVRVPSTTPRNDRTAKDTEHTSKATPTTPRNDKTEQDTGHTSKAPPTTPRNDRTEQDTGHTSKAPPTTPRNGRTEQDTGHTSKAPQTTLRNDRTEQDTGHTSNAPPTTLRNDRTEQDTGHTSKAPPTTPRNDRTVKDTEQSSKATLTTLRNDKTEQDTGHTSKAPPTTLRNDRTVHDRTTVSLVSSTSSAKPPGCRPFGKGFEEFIAGLGWVYSDCFGGKKFSQEHCACITPPFECNYVPYEDGYLENIPGIGDVYGDCPRNHKFNPAECKCTPGGRNTHSGNNRGNTNSISGCSYKASGSGYIEHIPGVGDVFSDCPPDHTFDEHTCNCVTGGASVVNDKIPSTGHVTPNPITNKACKLKATGDGYTEHISGVGDVYTDCAAGHTFSIVECACVQKGKVHVATVPTKSPTVNKNTAVCKYKSSGDGYTEHIAGVGDAYNDCPKDHTFNELVCKCIKKGIVVAVTPAPSLPSNTQKPEHIVTNPSKADCKYKSSGDGYTEHIAGVGDAYNDCPKDHTFNELVCKCIKKGTVVAVTQAPKPPANTKKPEPPVTNPNCGFIPSGTGYIEHIPGIGDVYNDCPPSEAFDVKSCSCTADSVINSALTTNKIQSKTGSSSDSSKQECERKETDDGGFLEYVPGFGVARGDCGPTKRFVEAVCSCVDEKN